MNTYSCKLSSHELCVYWPLWSLSAFLYKLNRRLDLQIMHNLHETWNLPLWKQWSGGAALFLLTPTAFLLNWWMPLFLWSWEQAQAPAAVQWSAESVHSFHLWTQLHAQVHPVVPGKPWSKSEFLLIVAECRTFRLGRREQRGAWVCAVGRAGHWRLCGRSIFVLMCLVSVLSASLAATMTQVTASTVWMIIAYSFVYAGCSSDLGSCLDSVNVNDICLVSIYL